MDGLKLEKGLFQNLVNFCGDRKNVSKCFSSANSQFQVLKRFSVCVFLVCTDVKAWEFVIKIDHWPKTPYGIAVGLTPRSEIDTPKARSWGWASFGCTAGWAFLVSSNVSISPS